MFLVRLVIVAGQLMYDPPLESIEQAVLEAFDAIVLRSANIDEITTKVTTSAVHAVVQAACCVTLVCMHLCTGVPSVPACRACIFLQCHCKEAPLML